MNTTTRICSCGDPNPHWVATRRTLDNKRVLLWENGDITSGMGFCLDRGRSLPSEAAWAFMENVCLYDYAELAPLLKAARKAAKKAQRADRRF